VILDSRPQVLRVPTEAVLEGYRVLVFQPDTQRLEERRFKPGLANWKYTEVLEGLGEGELIVVSVAREGVTAGARVNPEVQPSRASGIP
jgi:HlyD family secretion protein